jgi:chorismate synthase
MNSFGRIYRINIFGESHGQSVGMVIDGCPAGIELKESDFLPDLARRKSGAKGTTPRQEEDMPKIISGIFNGCSTGAPLAIIFENTNTRSSDYAFTRETPRPGHADYTASQKFGGFEDYRGGGHFSGRLTLGLVAAGVVAKKLIAPATVDAKLIEAGGIKNIDEAIEKAIKSDDSIGGIVECRALNILAGLGEPFFDSVESMISHLVFSIPATKGIEFGSGFAASRMKGSEHNDAFVSVGGKTSTNYAGGINGGITNGNELIFRVAVKPTSSTAKSQHTLNFRTNEMVDLQVKGRHDTCIALRVPVVVESVTAIVLADLMMLEQQRKRIIRKD